MGKRKVMDILQAAAAEIGGEVKQECDDLIVITHDKIGYFLLIDEKDRTFCLYHAVKGLKGELTEKEFDFVLDIVKDFYPNCDGVWNEQCSYVTSPWYRTVVNRKTISGETLGKIVDKFMEIWSFALVNAGLITDETVCGGVE